MRRQWFSICVHTLCASRCRKIVKHLQAIKRVNYDQDIKSDTRINRRSRTSRRAYFDVSLGRKKCFTIVLGANFFSFFVRSHRNWFHWPMNKCRTGLKRLVTGKLFGKWKVWFFFFCSKSLRKKIKRNIFSSKYLIFNCEIRTLELIILNIETNFNACVFSAYVQFETTYVMYLEKFFWGILIFWNLQAMR